MSPKCIAESVQLSFDQRSGYTEKKRLAGASLFRSRATGYRPSQLP
jgi:hypothetical protein